MDVPKLAGPQLMKKVEFLMDYKNNKERYEKQLADNGQLPDLLARPGGGGMGRPGGGRPGGGGFGRPPMGRGGPGGSAGGGSRPPMRPRP